VLPTPGCELVRSSLLAAIGVACPNDASAMAESPRGARPLTTGGVDEDRSMGVCRSEIASYPHDNDQPPLARKTVLYTHAFLLMDVSAHPANAPAAPVELSARVDVPSGVDGRPFWRCSGGSAESGFRSKDKNIQKRYDTVVVQKDYERPTHHASSQHLDPLHKQIDSLERLLSDGLLLVHKTDCHGGYGLAGHILLFIALDGRHQGHEPRNTSMHERVTKTPRKSWNEDPAIRSWLEVLGEPAEEDTRVGTDAGFGVHLCFCEKTEKIVVEDSVAQLWRDQDHGFDSRFSNNRNHIGETGQLYPWLTRV
jgi:hypothetical protein